MLERILARLIKPGHPRDLLSMMKVCSSLMGPVIGFCMCVAYVALTRNLWAYVPMVLLGGLVLGGSLALKHEIRLRKSYRSGRVALPPLLAEGVDAAERGDAERLYACIQARVDIVALDAHSLAIFDCLLRDTLHVSPELKADLLAIQQRST